MLPLSGLLVVSIEQAVAAPLCTARLAQAGARVIKIERETGDFARLYDEAAKGDASYFTWLNQGKESVCLDFKTEAGHKALLKLLKKADVLVQNLANGALERAGLSTATLQRINPRLIVCNISGYGTNNTAAKRPAYDLLIQAESGLISVSGSPNELGRIGVSVCDISTGSTAYSGVLEALIKRSISGKGDEISVSLFDVAADWMSVPFMHAEYGEGAPKPVGLKHPSIAPYGAFECKDGMQILISIQNEREWKRLCVDVLNAPHFTTTLAYATNNKRVTNRDALETEIQNITKQMSSKEFESKLLDAQIAYGAINSADHLKSHAAFSQAEFKTTNDETIVVPAPPIKWTNADELNLARPPKVGEHTDKVLKEFGAL
ncbi:MAG: CaiB/BaiF CoA transferase family protein [Nitratireductor sp.]